MSTDDFDFELPKELIAQSPLIKRDESKLMVMNKFNGDIQHKKFNNIVDMLGGNDVLVLNDTKVIPARLIGEKEETKAVIEVLLLEEVELNVWKTLVKPQKRVKIGTVVSFGDGKLRLTCLKKQDEGVCLFKLEYEGVLYVILDELGMMPLPPYITKKLEDKESYQTVYAKILGSAAAPTAGLHFTKSVLKQLEDKGVEIIYITLHVGLGTFRPVSVDDVTKHKMHSEFYSITKGAADRLNIAINDMKNIISVGTTTTRTLETVYSLYNEFKETSGYTQIFIYPGYEFKVINSLITNFHLPKSTLIMLVSALAGKENVLNAYKTAVEEKYRFFSFGDSMYIENKK